MEKLLFVIVPWPDSTLRVGTPMIPADLSIFAVFKLGYAGFYNEPGDAMLHVKPLDVHAFAFEMLLANQ
jgi:hypothetical protein